MGLTGKYDFPGIKKAGAVGLAAALATTSWGAIALKLPVVGTLIKGLLELASNWLANTGLVVLNLGAIVIGGELDQMGFDKALDEGLKQVELGRDKITPEHGKVIDDAVRDAARKFIKFNP
jgi:hypothetical protein